MNKILLGLITICLIITGCSTNNALNEDDMYRQYPFVEKLKSQLAESRSLELELFSPEMYSKAHQSYVDAIKLASQGNSRGEGFARDGLSLLSIAKTNAVKTRDILEEVLVARNKAIAAGAMKRQSSDFKKVDKDLLELTSLIESGKINKAKDGRAEVLTSYQRLELVTLKSDTVELTKKALKDARKRDIDDLAPKTIKLAKEEYQLALDILNADRNNKHKAQEHAKKSLWYVTRANQIVETLRHFKSSNYTEEDKVLWYQDQISKLVAPITSNVAYNLPNKEMIKELTTDIQNLVTELKAANAGKQQLTESKERISSKFNFVQSLFNINEAEVYRQANNVLIRAHGFDFPSGNSEINSSNFSLLNKITKAIKQFPVSKVVVSGHTDSVGSDELNIKLSQARAENVAKFLNQVGSIKRERIEFHGYGKQKPVASNEIQKGREANRRVEILIVN